MRCPVCGARMIKRSATAKNPYRYTLSGLPNVFLVGITVDRCVTCNSDTPTIPMVGDLHRAIAEAITKKPAPLSGAEIRFLRKNIGISAKDFASVLGITPETMSRFETGAQAPGNSIDRFLRLISGKATGCEPTREVILGLAKLPKGRATRSPRTPRVCKFELVNDKGWKPAAAA